MNPIEIAKSLTLALKDSVEYRNYQAAKEKVNQHEAARVMLEDFRNKQLEMYKKRVKGENIAEDAERLRKLSEIVSLNPYVREYLMAEFIWEKLLMDVQKTIAEGLGIDLSKMGLDEEGKIDEKDQ